MSRPLVEDSVSEGFGVFVFPVLINALYVDVTANLVFPLFASEVREGPGRIELEVRNDIALQIEVFKGLCMSGLWDRSGGFNRIELEVRFIKGLITEGYVEMA